MFFAGQKQCDCKKKTTCVNTKKVTQNSYLIFKKTITKNHKTLKNNNLKTFHKIKIMITKRANSISIEKKITSKTRKFHFKLDKPNIQMRKIHFFSKKILI